MKLFKISTSADALSSSGESKYISKSGIYDVTINFASVDVSKNGAQSVNFNIEYNGNSQTIYGPYITDTKQNPLKIGMQLINSLGIIAGLTDDDELELETETHNVGKDNKPQDFTVITQFTDLPIKIRLQEQYSVNPNTKEIRKSMVPKAFYRQVDGASAAEIINSTEIGIQLEKDKAYAENITYDGCTAEDVQSFYESKKSKPTQPTPAATKPTGSLFKK